MTIFVDEVRHYPGMGEWCHMWTDGSDSELDTFAASLGLKSSWAHTSQGYSGRFYHYDLRPAKRDLALKRGAIFKPLAQHIRERRRCALYAGEKRQQPIGSGLDCAAFGNVAP